MSDDGGERAKASGNDKTNGTCFNGKPHLWEKFKALTHHEKLGMCEVRTCLCCHCHDLKPINQEPEDHDKENEHQGIIGQPNVPYNDQTALFPWLKTPDDYTI